LPGANTLLPVSPNVSRFLVTVHPSSVSDTSNATET